MNYCVFFFTPQPPFQIRRNLCGDHVSAAVVRFHEELPRRSLGKEEVQSACERVVESQRRVVLYRTKLVPAAEQNVEVARTNYNTSGITYLEVAFVQRQLIDARERLLQAEVELQRRTAIVQRAAGGSLPDVTNTTDAANS